MVNCDLEIRLAGSSGRLQWYRWILDNHGMINQDSFYWYLNTVFPEMLTISIWKKRGWGVICYGSTRPKIRNMLASSPFMASEASRERTRTRVSFRVLLSRDFSRPPLQESLLAGYKIWVTNLGKSPSSTAVPNSIKPSSKVYDIVVTPSFTRTSVFPSALSRSTISP